jgi:hypothetical protein
MLCVWQQVTIIHGQLVTFFISAAIVRTCTAGHDCWSILPPPVCWPSAALCRSNVWDEELNGYACMAPATLAEAASPAGQGVSWRQCNQARQTHSNCNNTLLCLHARSNTRTRLRCCTNMKGLHKRGSCYYIRLKATGIGRCHACLLLAMCGAMKTSPSRQRADTILSPAVWRGSKAPKVMSSSWQSTL